MEASACFSEPAPGRRRLLASTAAGGAWPRTAAEPRGGKPQQASWDRSGVQTVASSHFTFHSAPGQKAQQWTFCRSEQQQPGVSEHRRQLPARGAPEEVRKSPGEPEAVGASPASGWSLLSDPGQAVPSRAGLWCSRSRSPPRVTALQPTASGAVTRSSARCRHIESAQ